MSVPKKVERRKVSENNQFCIPIDFDPDDEYLVEEPDEDGRIVLHPTNDTDSTQD